MVRTFLIIAPLVFAFGCSHMNPHFWPDSFQVPQQRSAAVQVAWRTPASAELITAEPSIARSEWKLLTKVTLAQRTYLLTIRDRDGKIIDTINPPEILLDGDVVLNSVSHAGVGKWQVKLDFPGEQAIVHVGFRIGEYQVDRFRRLHWQTHQLDRSLSAAYANKLRLRSDGKDKARIFVHLRDTQDFPIYQFHDYDLKLRVLSGHAGVEGPFSTVTGPYFLISSTQASKVKLEASIDGEVFGHLMHVEFIGKAQRSPASDGSQCVQALAKFLGKENVQNATMEEEYERLGEVMLDSFQSLITPSEMQLEENLQALSSPACTAIAKLDQLRESFSTRMRQVALKSHRTAQGKGNIHNMWNPHRTPQR